VHDYERRAPSSVTVGVAANSQTMISINTHFLHLYLANRQHKQAIKRK